MKTKPSAKISNLGQFFKFRMTRRKNFINKNLNFYEKYLAQYIRGGHLTGLPIAALIVNFGT